MTINKKKKFSEKPFFFIILILILTFIAFYPSLKNDFISTWDDQVYITGNPVIRHLDMQSVKTMFTTSVNSSYVPLPLLTFAIEYRLFGPDPLPYHITNMVLYLLCTLLVLMIFRLLNLGIVYAALATLLFSIHPMHVESVAWITERKDMLFGLFYLLSLIVYLKYIRSNTRRLKWLVISLLFFILALFSKIQAVTLPVILLVTDYYLERPFKRDIIFEKIPYIILAFIFGITGIFILKEHGSLQDNEISRLSERIFYGFYALSGYVVKFFAPFHLSAFYPYPHKPVHPLPVIYYLNPFILLFLAVLIYRTVRYTRAIVFGTLFFLFNIILMLQILAAGTTYLSDRYAFIPYMGLCFIAGWAMEKTEKNRKVTRHIITAAVAVVIILFIPLTFDRCKTWKNPETLWSDVIDKYPSESPIPYICRGIGYGNQDQWEKAIADYSRAIGINPDYTDAWSNRGVAYGHLGQFEKAINDCSKAIGINPHFAKAYSNRGLAYSNLGQWDKAIADYNLAIENDHEYANAYFNRGCAFGNTGQWEKAIPDFTKAIELDPQLTAAYSYRNTACEELGKKAQKTPDQH